MQYINTIEIRYGVLIKILLKGSFAVKLEINIKALRLKLSSIANISAKENEIKDIKIVINPSIIFIPKKSIKSKYHYWNYNNLCRYCY